MAKEPPRSLRTIRIKNSLWDWANAFATDHGHASMGQFIEDLIAEKQAGQTPQIYVRATGEGMVLLPMTMVVKSPSRFMRREWVEKQCRIYELLDEVLKLPGVQRAVLFETYPGEGKRFRGKVLAEAVLPSCPVPETSGYEVDLETETLALLREALEGKVVTHTTAAMKSRLANRFRSLGSFYVSMAVVHEKTQSNHVFVSAHVGTKTPLDDASKGVLLELATRLKLVVV